MKRCLKLAYCTFQCLLQKMLQRTLLSFLFTCVFFLPKRDSKSPWVSRCAHPCNKKNIFKPIVWRFFQCFPQMMAGWVDSRFPFTLCLVQEFSFPKCDSKFLTVSYCSSLSACESIILYRQKGNMLLVHRTVKQKHIHLDNQNGFKCHIRQTKLKLNLGLVRISKRKS